MAWKFDAVWLPWLNESPQVIGETALFSLDHALPFRKSETRMRRFHLFMATLLSVCVLASPQVCRSQQDSADQKRATSSATVDFEKDVQPILRSTCYSCHGVDEQEGGLRLDLRERAFQGGDSGKAIHPKDSAKSPLLIRVIGGNPDLDRMPPEGEGTPLNKRQIATLRAWIDQGANWPADADVVDKSKHWAFQPIRRPAPPKVEPVEWVRNPIDAFILAKLQAEVVKPSPPASREMLLRRLYLDLLGLPPSADMVEAFLKDESPGAFAKVVEEVLKSKHYGERWGRHWLDLARYADSDGYEKDRPRPHAWRYRQWIIDALNADMPFDEFSIRQIAGDMLPGADLDARVATGFHRNTLHNTEGGTDKEEDRVKKTVDRINTVSSIWLGLTLGCAQCHSHKYDPITQREYYSMYSFFNSIDEKDIAAPMPDEQAKYLAAKSAHQKVAGKMKEELAVYRAKTLAPAAAKWAETIAAPSVVWNTWTPADTRSKHAAKLKKLEDDSYLVSGTNQLSDVYYLQGELKPMQLNAIRLEVLPDKSLVKSGPGRANNGNFVLTTFTARVLQPGKEALAIKFKRAEHSYAQPNWEAQLAINDNSEDGWAVGPQFGKRHVAMFVVESPVAIAKGAKLEIVLDQNYNQANPHNLGRFRVSLTDASAPTLEGDDAKLAAALKVAAKDRTPAHRKVIEDHFAKQDATFQTLSKKLAEHNKKAPAAPKTMAQTTLETGKPRDTRIHIRGDFLNKGELVPTRTLSVLPELKSRGDRPDRLDFARWLMSKDHPLTARVTVNRIWQRYFGVGLVATSDDFGSQGEAPSHPELLDWLAAELRDKNWSLKHLHRTIVMSSTYQQSSAHRPELADRDPRNRWLARQSRRRVEAEIVRDLALSVSDLLDPKIGGPSVRPRQPAEYAKLTYANSARWQTSKGGDQYRRGLYTFFQRTSPYPMLMTFDSPDANACTAQRATSNTPLQALALWNDPVFFECAQMLGRRIYGQAEGADEAAIRKRISRAFLICLSRYPHEDEVQAIRYVYDQQRKISSTNEKTAKDIAGQQPLPDGADAVEISAWVIVGRILLNVDEFVAKE